jgi:photosystem II stability/assembly factor-like uncharacterized protein
MRQGGASFIVAIAALLFFSGAASANNFNDLLLFPAVKSKLSSASALMDVVNTGKRLVAVGERGHILVSDDSGNSWTQVAVPTSVTLTAVFFPTPEKGWAVGHDGIVLHSADGGLSWTKQLDGSQINIVLQTQIEQMVHIKKTELDRASSQNERDRLEIELENLQFFASDAQMAVNEGPTRPFMDLWFKNDQEGIVVGSFGMILSTSDGGETWQPILDRIDNFDAYHYYAITPAGDALFIVGERGMLFRSWDEGQSWETLESPYEGSYFGVAGSHDGSLVVVFGLRGNAFASFDKGRSWVPIDAAKGSTLSGSTFLADGSLLIVANDGIMTRSTDGGKSFHVLPVRYPGSIGLAEADSSDVVVVGLSGVHQLKKSVLDN